MDTQRNEVRVTLGAVLVAALVVVTPGWSAAGQTDAEVTFTKDVAPILQRSCQSCHRSGPGGGAPMSLSTYSEVRPWARAIKERTAQRTMPPWFIDKNVGVQEFKDDPSLSAAEIATIARWVDDGAPQGNPADMPPPREFPDGKEWTIGEPDWIVSSPEFTVKALASDWHGYLEPSPTGMTEDRHIRGVEVHEVGVQGPKGSSSGPRGYSTIHHMGITASVPTADGSQQPTGIGRAPGGFGMTHEAGQNATRYREGMGVLLRANAELAWRAHISSFGEEVTRRVDVGFTFHPRDYTPTYTARGGGVFMTNNDLDIGAGDNDVRVDAIGVIRAPSMLVTFEPHMHAGGRKMCVNAHYPNGIQETLTCAGYDHNWVKVYQYADHAAPLLPAGTVLHTMAWYDNSQANRNILEPRNWHGLGSRSMDDMFFFLGRFVGLTEEQYDEELAARMEMRDPTAPGMGGQIVTGQDGSN